MGSETLAETIRDSFLKLRLSGDPIPTNDPTVTQIREARQKRGPLPIQLEDGTIVGPPLYDANENQRIREQFTAHKGRNPKDDQELTQYFEGPEFLEYISKTIKIDL